ncbi:MAG: hypothetical protein IPI43_34510 [Sandaracinaceae bacterium]|nr:hypothetical protein [Sandaracinaceae bacterium]
MPRPAEGDLARWANPWAVDFNGLCKPGPRASCPAGAYQQRHVFGDVVRP